MTDEWNAYERLRHAVLTEVPTLLGTGAWCLDDAHLAMRGARGYRHSYRSCIEQLDRLVREGLLRLEQGAYVPVTPVQRPAA